MESLDLGNWMGNLPEAAKNKPIVKTYMVRTHNAASDQFIDVEMPGEVGPISLATLERWRRRSRFWDRFLGDWSLCQNWSIKEQLENGVRWFDFRVAYADNRFVFAHAFACSDARQDLEDIKEFMDTHPNEIVVMAVNRDWRNRATMTSTRWHAFSLLTIRIFGAMIRPVSESTPRIRECQEDRRRLILAWTHEDVALEGKIWKRFKSRSQIHLTVTPTTQVVAKDLAKRIFLGCCYTPLTVQTLGGTSEEKFEKVTNKSDYFLWSVDGLSRELSETIVRMNWE